MDVSNRRVCPHVFVALVQSVTGLMVVRGGGRSLFSLLRRGFLAAACRFHGGFCLVLADSP